jgi:hypothetical protein
MLLTEALLCRLASALTLIQLPDRPETKADYRLEMFEYLFVHLILLTRISQGLVAISKPKRTFCILNDTTAMKRNHLMFGTTTLESPPTVLTGVFISSLLWLM